MSDDLLPGVVARLRAAGCVWAEDEASLLAEAAASGADLDDLVSRRVAGQPLETLVGWVDFLGRRLVVAPGTFVPRRRTQLLARIALERAAADHVAVEMCCGVAPVAAALDGRVADLHAADICGDALACAAVNAPGASLHRGDLWDALPRALRGRVGLLVANAPYVPTARIALMPPEARDHEPHQALDGGTDGVDLHRRLATGAGEWLAPGGLLLVETSPGQAELTTTAMRTAGLATSLVTDDELGGCVAIGERSAQPGTSSGGSGVTTPASASASSISSREMPSR